MCLWWCCKDLDELDLMKLIWYDLDSKCGRYWFLSDFCPKSSNTIPTNQVLEGKISWGLGNTSANGRLGVPHMSNFFLFAMTQFDWPHKKIETIKAPQNRRFCGKMECFHIWPTYWEPDGNHWEHVGNKWRMKKSLPPPPTTLLKT